MPRKKKYVAAHIALSLIFAGAVGNMTDRIIYEYVIDGEERHLNLRAFDDAVKYKVYEEQGHKCPYCDKSIDGHTYPDGKDEYDYNEMEGDHIVPWSQGGKTEIENCQMLCKWHNGHKSAK